MPLIDIKFRKNKLRYILQCLLAMVAAMLVLTVLDFAANKVVVASLGASCFIVFTMPHARASTPRRLLGGYAVGLAIGTTCYWLSVADWPNSMAFLSEHSLAVFGGLAIGSAMFIMVITNTEHPPAASIALGLVMKEWSLETVMVAAIEVIMLCVLKRLIKPILIDLL